MFPLGAALRRSVWFDRYHFIVGAENSEKVAVTDFVHQLLANIYIQSYELFDNDSRCDGIRKQKEFSRRGLFCRKVLL